MAENEELQEFTGVIEPRQKILVADDEASIRRILETRLKMVGYDVVVAEDGEEAVNVFNKTNPDLVVLDVMMPKMDGYGVTREIRRTSDVPIIILTALGDVSERITGLELGADDIDLGNSGNLELIRVAIQGLRNDFNNLSPEILSKLNAILNKIPAGCNCNCDTAEIIAKLEIIITKLESGNHEGILDDLDNLNGALN